MKLWAGQKSVLQSKEIVNSKYSNELGMSEGQKGYNDQSITNKNGKMRLKRQAGARTQIRIL